MRSIKSAVALAALAFADVAAAQDNTSARPSFAEPSLSPDGTTIAFVSGGDIWEVPATGGTARLLISDEATEGRPLYSPDGTKLAYVSARSGGNANIYLLDLASGRTTRLTWAEGNEELDSWAPDSRSLLFASGIRNISRSTEIYRVNIAGGTPLPVAREDYVPLFQAAVSPDGQRLALVARGISQGQWWRNGHSHIDETEVWVKPVGGDGAYTRVLPDGAKNAWPQWSADGATLTFMSDRSGVENLWQVPATGGEPRQLTRFTEGRVLWPQMARDGGAVVFERGMAIWRYDAASGQAAEVPITLRGAPAGALPRHLTLTSFDALALAPDGKKVAMIGHGELFALPTKDGTTERVTTTVGAESSPVWSSDSRHMLYVGERGTDRLLYEYDAATRQTAQITAKGNAQLPSYSPDGKSAVYVQGKHEMRLVTLPRAGKPAVDRLLYAGNVDPNWTGAPAAWSPDGRYVAFPVLDARAFTNVWIAPAAGGPARQASFLANGNMAGLAWSPDGKYLLFDSSQRAEPSKIVRVDLTPHVPSYREDVFRDLFKTDTPPGAPAKDKAPAKPTADKARPAKEAAVAKPGLEIAWEGLRDRATILPLGMGAMLPRISPDGKTLVFRSDEPGSANLYSYNLDELASEPPTPKQITANAKPKGDFAITADSKTLWFLEGGTIMQSPLDNPRPTALAARAEMDVDFDAEKRVAFDEAWTLLNDYFYDPQFHGKDWAGLYRAYQPYVAGARTGDEMRRITGLMIGELNASHSGISNPNAAEKNRVGDLGLSFDRAAAEAGRGLVVREVLNLGPADVSGKIKPGDTLVSVDGTALTPTTNLDALLERKVGKQVVLGVQTAAARRSVTVQPISSSVASGLRYRQWVASRRALVDQLSAGKLGYVHLFDMSDASLDQFYLDLDAQNQSKAGVVVDVRNNNGGYVHGRVLDALSRSEFLRMTPRDLTALPSRQALGQRALGLPTVLLTNESTLSDGEDFSEGYRALGLGKIVGQPTAGWIIYTSNVPLIEGSSVRVPSIRIEDNRGQNMELNPRPVDIAVEQPLGQTASGSDAQLAAAVDVLLKQIGAR